MRRFALVLSAVPTLVLYAVVGPVPAGAVDPGVGSVPQGTQTDASYAASFAANHVTNTFATTQRVSCYTPEVPFAVSNGPNDGYTGESACPGATTGEDLGPYATQQGSNPGFPAARPVLVKDHSESDIQVDPTDPMHVIGSSKWFASAEGYNHLLGFYESRDGGRTWPVQGHIPGYEGWTDNTDPVGAFDGFGNFYELILPYQFFYNADTSHNLSTNPNEEPNPGQAAEVIAAAVRPHGSMASTQWITTHNGHTDVLFPYDQRGHEPDKQWLAIDTNPSSPHFNRIYAMWVDFTTRTAHPVVAFADARPDGTHTDWSQPIPLPMGSDHPNGSTFLLPHIAPDGTVYTTLETGFPAMQFTADKVILDRSGDGGRTWSTLSTVADGIVAPPGSYPNTTFRDGIEQTFAVGRVKVGGQFPLYVAWEDFSAGSGNVLLSASYDGGLTWRSPIQVNDNQSAADEFQPNLAVSASGTVSVNFYDRRLACPAASTEEAAGAGLALDRSNPSFSGSLPPFGAANYCINASIQFYDAGLSPLGHNVRLTQHAWDPQLNSPHPTSAATALTFIGDYFGNTIAGRVDLSTFVSTFDDGTNPAHYQQQVVATIGAP
jgi:hypothetical protein